jgi:hypothetical protein
VTATVARGLRSTADCLGTSVSRGRHSTAQDVVLDKHLAKLFTVHIIDKGKPLYDYAK